MLSPSSAIGVFDSGLGGLTVLKSLNARLPQEDFIYLGDIARLPYGTKSPEVVTKYSLKCAETLLKQNIKALVVACNTASAVALPNLKKTLSLPILGVIEPGVRSALAEGQDQTVLVMATTGTVKSNAYPTGFQNQGFKGKVLQLACPLLVPLAEEGWFETPITEQVLNSYLAKVPIDLIDTYLLGCTHYPLLLQSLRNCVGTQKAIVHGGDQLALELQEELTKRNLLSNKKKGSLTFLSTDQISAELPILQKLFPQPITFSVIDF